jgi:uncharacterized protein YuzE
VSEERLAHLNDEHPEMVGQESLIVETLAEPDAVVQSQSDPDVRLYHRLYSHPVVGDKYMLVVVKWLSEDFFSPDRSLHGWCKARRNPMEKAISIWYDPEGDILEVVLEKKPGYFKETALDQVMAKVDMEGRVIGFSILKVSSLKGKPLDLSLTTA